MTTRPATGSTSARHAGSVDSTQPVRLHACGLARPTGLDGLEPKSDKKKLKQPSFAAGVHRDEVYAGAELLGLELDEHITNVVAAMQPIARELGLRTAGDAA